jgi:hypothetical protein
VVWQLCAQAATARRLAQAARALRHVDEPLPYEQRYAALQWRVAGVDLRGFPVRVLLPALFLALQAAAALAAVAPATAALLSRTFL